MGSKVVRALGNLVGKTEQVCLSGSSTPWARSTSLPCRAGAISASAYARVPINSRLRQYATLAPSRAIVASEPGPEHHGGDNWAMTDIKVPTSEVSIGSTGFPPVVEGSYYATDTRGAYVQVGGPTDPHYRMSLDLVQHLFRGVKLWSCVEGDSYPGDFIPQLIEYYREGKLPIDKMVGYYKAEDFKTALHDMHTEKTIKPVLTW